MAAQFKAINGCQATAEIVNRLRHNLLARAFSPPTSTARFGPPPRGEDRPQRLDRGTFTNQLHTFGRLLGDLALVAVSFWRSCAFFQGHRRMGGQFNQSLLIFQREGAGKLVDQLGTRQIARPIAFASEHRAVVRVR